MERTTFFDLRYLVYTNSKLKYIIFIAILQNIGFAKLKPVRGYIFEENLKPLHKVKVISIPSRTTTDTNEEGLFFIEIPIRGSKNNI